MTRAVGPFGTKVETLPRRGRVANTQWFTASHGMLVCTYVKTYVQDIRRIRFVQTARRSGRLQIALWHVAVESPSTGGFER